MSRYADAHREPKGPGDARPTALQIVEDEGLVGKLTGKAFVVTGVSSGIGVETMRALYATGAHVFGTVRDREKGNKVAGEIIGAAISKKQSPLGEITLIDMDLADFESVRQGAQQILRHPAARSLNGIVNNAGVMATPENRTEDGFETQFGTNHLGHFLLFQCLMDKLLGSATPNFPSRVVPVSSFGHRSSEIRFHDFNFNEPYSYDKWQAYGQSKTANIYFSNELERRYGSLNLHSTSLHPGGIMAGLQIHVEEEMKVYANDAAVFNYLKSPAQGAATSVYALLSEEWKHKGGRYLSDCVEAKPYRGDPHAVIDDGYAKWAYDEAKEKRLWKHSCKIVSMPDDNIDVMDDSRVR